MSYFSFGAEYDEKMTDYAKLGVLYYVIYNPDYWRRDCSLQSKAVTIHPKALRWRKSRA